jgi:V8-like Glu-specific endopeptidase
MSSAVVNSWVYSTMLIENEWGEVGTGFLVFRGIDEKKGRVFLVTNKHVLHEDIDMREKASNLTLNLNIKNKDGSIVGKTALLPLVFDDGSKKWREHPNNDVDVIAIDVTQGIVEIPQIMKVITDYTWFANKEELKRLDITMGDEVIVIGYPLGLRHKTNNLPLLRQGMIATRIGEELEDEVIDNGGKVRKRTLRGFLVDGATIPGSSGSPVVLKPISGRLVNGSIQMGLANPFLLGIIAETKFAPIQNIYGKVNNMSFAGLGLAFDSDTIKETIELFF